MDEKERKLRVEFIFKDGRTEVAKIRGKLILSDDKDRDLEVLKTLWDMEQATNMTHANLRLHIHLTDMEGEEQPLRPKYDYGEQPLPHQIKTTTRK